MDGHCCFAGCYGLLHHVPENTLHSRMMSNGGRLTELVIWMDSWLDSAVSPEYQSQPLAQDWARVAKTSEEAGEAIDALIGITGQNPRKGTYGEKEHLLEELADVALTGLYAIQHFTKNGDQTMRVLLDRAQAHYDRVFSKNA